MYLRLFYFIAIIIYPILALPISITNIETELPTITDLPNTNQNDTRDESIRSQNENSNETVNLSQTDTLLRNELRPGMTVLDYAVNIEADTGSETFSGSVIVRVTLNSGTEGDEIQFHAKDLNINSVTYAIRNGDVYNNADFELDNGDGVLTIDTGRDDIRSYTFVIEYTGSMDAIGLYHGTYNNYESNYVAMNLHPIHARRVFPCIDEPSQLTTISFNFENFEYENIVTNSLPEGDSGTEFRALQGPPNSWGMVAHNFREMNIPTTRVHLHGRQGIFNQERISSSAITFYFSFLNEWTNKEYFDILNDQNDNLHIIALPDVSIDWFALSTICIWEPYILMEDTQSVKQKMDAFIKIAEALTGQWYGYVVYPESWRFEWIVTGLRKHVAYEMVREFQTPAAGTTDESLFDTDVIFTVDIIQESLLQDAYTNAQVLEPADDLTDEIDVMLHVNGLIQYKAPAILWMLKSVLAGNSDEDFMQMAARGLLNNWSLEPATPVDFYESIYSGWDSGAIDNVQDFLEPFLTQNGYPLILVSLRQGGVIVTQQRFGFSNRPQMHFDIPLTYSLSNNPNFENTAPIEMMEQTTLIDFSIDDDDYVLFNVQGQGYYRVNYDNDLWERIIMALENPESRNQIHPLNRASLLDDALNIARADRLDYDIALRIVLTMEHETHYAVWKAFVRNMNFIQKRLLSHIEQEGGDPDIYTRMIRRTIIAFEEEIGFYPDTLTTYPAMTSLTRGLVMDHACRANYEPCIAAAVDWFYDPNSQNSVVNPDIPHDIRPAVYCTMVREGGDEAIDALNQKLEDVQSMYDRLVILESLACSSNENFIGTLLDQTVAGNSPYSPEERYRIFLAVADSSFNNARVAINFISTRTNDIRSMYGGVDKLNKLIFKLIEDMVEPSLTSEFERWMNSGINNLDTSQVTANLAYDRIHEDLQWYFNHVNEVYDWIDENDAPTLMASLSLLSIIFIVNAFLNF